MNVILVDDEERARNSLQLLLKEYCPEVCVLATASNVPEAVLAIQTHRPQLVFLDIEMPDYSGFELLNFFREVDFEIIFVTAYHEFALKAFEVSAVDYLLKPVDIEKLKLAVNKAGERLNNSQMQSRLDLLKDNFKSEQFNRIALPMAEGLLFIEVKDIIYLEAEGAYTRIWVANGSSLMISKRLKFFEDILQDRPNFFRSHRSYMVNINYLKKYNKGESSLTLDNGKTVFISRDKKGEFEAQLKRNKMTLGY